MGRASFQGSAAEGTCLIAVKLKQYRR